MKKSTLVILISAVTVAISMGARQSFGLFLQPVTEALSTGRETFSLAMALQNILFGLPLAGMLADHVGPRRVVAAGAFLYAAGFLLLAVAAAPWLTFLSLGVLIGFALSATSYVVLLGAVARVVPAEKRVTSFGIVTAAGSFGTFAVVPLIQWLIDAVSWQDTLLYAAAVVAAIGLFAIGFPPAPRGGEGSPTSDIEEGFSRLLSQAGRHSGYLLLNAGFFVCGFHVAFIATHLPAYLGDHGLPEMAAAAALALIGLFNMAGSYLFGRLGDRYRKKYLLSFLYFARALVISGCPGGARHHQDSPGLRLRHRFPLAGDSAADQRYRCPDIRSRQALLALRDRFLQPPGRRLPRGLARGPHLRRHRFLRRCLGGRHRARSRGRGRPPADQGPRSRQPPGCPCIPLTAVPGSTYH